MQRITENGKQVIVLSQAEWMGLGRTPQPKNMRFDVSVRAEIWVDPDEIENHVEYDGIVRSQLPEDQKIAKLKECARQIAQDELDNTCRNRSVQISGEVTLADVNFDRIDWVSLASPAPLGPQANAQKPLQKEALSAQPISPQQTRQFLNTNLPEASGYGIDPKTNSAITNVLQDVANQGPAGAQKIVNFIRPHNVTPPKPAGLQQPPKPTVDPAKASGGAPSSGGTSGIGSSQY